MEEERNAIKQYIRGRDRRKKGIMVAFLNEEQDSINIGWALCSNKDTFDYDLGLEIAVGRAESASDEKPMQIAHSIKNELFRFSKRAIKYFRIEKTIIDRFCWL